MTATYNHKALAAALNVSLRTLDNHKAALESRYDLQLAVKQGRLSVYKPEYLGLIQTSIKGLELPETLEGYTVPAFIPFVPEPLQTPVASVVEAELLDDLSGVDTSAMTVYNTSSLTFNPVTPRKSSELAVTNVDLSALDQAIQGSDQGIKDMMSAIIQRSSAMGSVLGKVAASQIEQAAKAEIEQALVNVAKKLDVGA